ncbi:MAG TPA: hypothetical protein VF599_01065 [Pyrinomonadaceae bacterium]|jgi:hypothetical protein
MNNNKHLFIRIAAVCAILAPLTLLAGDLVLIIGERRFEWTIVLWLAFVLFVPAIIGLTHVAFGRGNKLALVGGALAFFGAMAGASMQILFRVYAVLDEAGDAQASELLQKTMKLIATTQMIGIFFPIGLILLSISIYKNRIFNRLTPLLLAAGAILFPIGRIGGLAIAVIGSGLVLIAAFGLIGWQIINTVENSSEPAQSGLR